MIYTDNQTIVYKSMKKPSHRKAMLFTADGLIVSFMNLNEKNLQHIDIHLSAFQLCLSVF